METTTKVVLRFFTPPALADSLMLEAFQPRDSAAMKERALTLLGITRAADEKPLAAWLRAMHAENGLPYTRPAHPAIVEACQGVAVSSWVLFIA